LLAVNLAACVVPAAGEGKSGLPDGAECTQASDCRSGGCNRNRLCAHSLCDCPGDTCTSGGEVSKDCQAGWLCVYYKSLTAPVGEFFGIEGDLDGGYCQIPCSASCPKHYLCGSQDLCVADPDWANPIPSLSWTGGVQGELHGSGQFQNVKLEPGLTVTLSASAESPIHENVTNFAWTIVSSAGDSMTLETQSVDVTLAEADAYRRAELVVSDAALRSAQLSVSFEACLGRGKACGYQGSGCCSTCDADGKLCF
jgi:hypothetical protein